MNILYLFIYIVLLKNSVIFGRSLTGGYAQGPPIFQALSPYKISGHYL
jgi:hypothetical protein